MVGRLLDVFTVALVLAASWLAFDNFVLDARRSRPTARPDQQEVERLLAGRTMDTLWLTPRGGVSPRLDSRIPVHAITSEAADPSVGLFAGSGVRVWHAASSKALADQLPSPLVPVTLVLSPGGRVTYARVGILTSAASDSVIRLLSPGRAEAFD